MNRFDGPFDDNGDDDRDVLAIVDLSEAEVEAGWRQFSERHLQPDHLFRLAVGLREQSSEDEAHLARCEKCRSAVEDYRSTDSTIAANQPVAIEKSSFPSSEYDASVANPSTGLGNGKPRGVSGSKPPACLIRYVPDLIFEHLRIESPIVFPGDEVAVESWQFGRILHIAHTDTRLAERLTDTIAEHAKVTLLPHLGRDNVMLVCFGRAMHRCGTRLAALLDDCGFKQTHVVLAHDFYSPTLICDQAEFRNAEVFVLVDVVHTGGMLDRLLKTCRDYHPLRVGGLALIDQSGGKTLSGPWFSVWSGHCEARMSIVEFLRNTPAMAPEQLQRYEPNDECGVIGEVVDKRCQQRIIAGDSAACLDPELLTHIHVTGALKSDFAIGPKRYPYVVNVLDLLKDNESRQFILGRAKHELSDLMNKKVCLAYHAGRWQRAGAIAKALSEELDWPAVPIGRRGSTFALTDEQYRRLACYDDVVLVDAAIRTGDSIAAIVRAVDDLWLRKHTRFSAFCILDALSSISKSELAMELGVNIRTLFTLPLAPPTQEVRHWVNAQKAILRDQIGSSSVSARVRDILGPYCEPNVGRQQEAGNRPIAETRAIIEKAVSQAEVPVYASRAVISACQENKAHIIRHLSVNEVVHDRGVQDLLVGIMFNSMKPQFKESAALALASVHNFDWMTLDWLKRNRPFLTSAGNAWKSILLVECQMKMTDHVRELSRFRDAAFEFRKSVPSLKRANGRVAHSQMVLPGINCGGVVNKDNLRDGSYTSAAEIRLRERMDVLVEAAD